MKTIHIAFACLLLAACAGHKDSKEYGNESSKTQSTPPADLSAPMQSADGTSSGSKTKESESSPNAFISSSAAVVTKRDSTRKFIRTADMKFKVNSVQRSTYQIEDIIVKHNGYVTLSNLYSTISYKNTTPVSADSVLESTYYVTANNMTLRVPNVSLDSTLKEIAKQIIFLDYRVIKAEDVSLQMMANKWLRKRSEKHGARLEKAIDEKGRKLNETTDAEESLENKEAAADQALLNNMSFSDQVNYSTITLQIYQRDAVMKELIANEKNIRAYEPGWWSKAKEAVTEGWRFLEGFFLFLLNIWPILPFGLLIWAIFKRLMRKKN